MRQIGHLPDEQQARLFGDYLVARGVRNDIEREDASWGVWVHDDDQLEEARRCLEAFRRNPSGAEYTRAAGSTDRQLSADERSNRAWQRRFFDRTRVFPGSRSFGAGVFTYTLIVGCVAVGLLSKLGSDRSFVLPLFISTTLGPDLGLLPEVRAGQVWRLFTPVLIHFGAMHLLFNMMWLFQLGSMIETLQGRWRFAALVLVIAVVSNVAQYLVGGPGFGGMSGVVYGLFGYVWVRGRLDPSSGLFLDRHSVVLMLIWFGLCFTGWVGPIANAAHAGGLFLGAGWGAITGWWASRGR